MIWVVSIKRLSLSRKVDECKTLARGRVHWRGGRRHQQDSGRAVQVDPWLTADDRAWFQQLKLKYDEPLSNLGSNFKSRPFTVAAALCGTRRHIRRVAATLGRSRRRGRH